MTRPFRLLVLAVACLGGAARAQEPGVRIGITYTPGVRPGLLVLRGEPDEVGDSIAAILERDLDYSDRFEIVTLAGGERLYTARHAGAETAQTSPGQGGGFVNYSLYGALGAEFAVAVERDSAGPVAVLFDVRAQALRRRLAVRAASLAEPGFRMAVHRAADEIVRAAMGEAGYAASRILFVRDGRLYRVDADGGDLAVISPPGERVFSPAWGPRGRLVAYAVLSEGLGRLVLLDTWSGERRVVGPTQQLLNLSPAFSPDGEWLAFTRIGDEGSEVYRYNLARDCCLQRLTVGRFADNLSPTFSPDGRRIAYVSTRAGLPQIYVMAADGTGQELFAPFDYGVTGSSYAPEWSPDGTKLVFHRDVAGSPQVFVMETRSGAVRQLTSAGRNEDPTWAPDGRHIAFVSSRSGAQQLWVIDLETGRIRQLTMGASARLPAWSPRLGEVSTP